MEIAAPQALRTRVRSAPSARTLIMGAGALLAVVCALLAQHPGDPWQVPAWVVTVSLLAIGIAALVFPDPLAFTDQTMQSSGIHVRAMVAAAIVLALPTLVAVLIWSQEPFTVYHAFVRSSSTWAALLWIAGMVGALLMLWPGAADRSWAWLRQQPTLWLVLEALAALVILDVAAGLRFYHLSTLPEGVWFDEVDFANSAEALRTMPFQPFGAFNVGHNPSLYFYVLAFLFKLNGMSIGTARLDAALFGLLAVICVYGLGRRVGGPALGLSAAAFLAVAQWAVDFSRFGMSNIAAPATISAGFLALAMAMYRPRVFWFALSGLLLGLSLLTYAGGFLAGAGVAVLVVAARLIVDGTFRRAAWPAALFLPLGLIVGAAPFLTALGLDRSYTLDRESTVSLFTEYTAWPARISALGHNLRLHLLMFTVAGDNNGRHNLPGAPMLDTVTGACFLLGLGISFRRLYHWFYLLLICWLGASMLGGILSLDFEAPQGARTVGAVAPIALIAALPLAVLAQGVWLAAQRLAGSLVSWRTPAASITNGLRRGREQLLAVALAALVVCVPLGIAYARNVHQYFVEQASNVSVWNDMDGLQAILGREAAALQQQGYSVLIDPSLAGDPIVQFTSGGLNIPAFDTGVPVPLPVPASGLALLIPATSQNVLDYVRQSFPTIQILPLAPAFDHTQTQAYAVIVRPADVAASLGVSAQFSAPAANAQHVQGPISWPAASGPRSTATIRSTLMITSAEAWQPLAFRVAGGSQATLSIDGQRWTSATGMTSALRLGAGNHQLIAQVRGRSAQALTLEWNATADVSSSLIAQAWTPLPPTTLAAPTLPTGGLLGLYYNGAAIGDRPALARVDQTIYTYYQTPPTGGGFPFAARWLGTLHITQNGEYAFRLDSEGPGTLLIDGHAVVSSAGGPVTGAIDLGTGHHTFQLDYTGAGSYLHCYLTWAPPGQSFNPIPASATMPAHG